MAKKEFGGSRRRTGARVEKHDADFAFREGLIDDWKITDDESEEAEAESAFENGEDALDGSVRSDIAETESKKRGAAEIEAGLKRRPGGIARGVAVIQESEADDQAGGPKRKQNQQGKGPEETEESFAFF